MIKLAQDAEVERVAKHSWRFCNSLEINFASISKIEDCEMGKRAAP